MRRPARKSSRARAPSPPSATQDGLELRRTPVAERWNVLTKEHDRLLAEISKKRAALAALEEFSRELNRGFLARVEPVRSQFEAALEQLAGLFSELQSPSSRLSSRDKGKVANAHAQLLAGLPLELQRVGGLHPNAEATHAPPPSESGKEASHASHAHGARPPNGDRSTDHEHSAPKPGSDHTATLRALFRRLAIALHPDKVQDEDTKQERTTVMKQVTGAYEAGDVARLVELERALLAPEPESRAPEDLDQRVAQLLASNRELRRQLRRLTAEQKAFKQTLLVHVDWSDPAKDQARAKTELDHLLAELLEELEQLRSLVTLVGLLGQGKMTTAEFLASALP